MRIIFRNLFLLILYLSVLMKTQFLVLLFIISFFSCKPKVHNSSPNVSPSESDLSFVQNLLDSSKVKGSVLIFDPQNNRYLSNDFTWAKEGNLPASTFKITNSLIGIELGILEDLDHVFKWDGEKRMMKIWEKDLTLKEAFHASCVPCYQELAREIGVSRMRTMLDSLEYETMVFSEESIDNFWLVGESKINQFQQIDFLQRLYNKELPINANTYSLMKDLMVREENENFTLSGKTGWSISKNNGWFVGYVERQKDVYFFATNIEPMTISDIDSFKKARVAMTYEVLRELKIIE